MWTASADVSLYSATLRGETRGSSVAAIALVPGASLPTSSMII